MFRPTTRLALAALLLGPGPAAADLPRPLDERATARLIADEVARQEPRAGVERSATRAWIVLHLPDGSSSRLFIDDIHQALREEQDGAERESLLRGFVAGHLAAADAGTAAGPEPAEDMTRVMPVLRSVAQPDDDATLGGHPVALLIAPRMPFRGDVFQCWTFEGMPAGFDCLSPITLGDDDPDALARLGLGNLEQRARDLVETTSGRFHRLALGRKLGSSMLLLNGYWAARAQDGWLIAAIPTTNELIWIANASQAEIDHLRKRARALYDAGSVVSLDLQEREVQAVSPELYLWTGDGWAILPP